MICKDSATVKAVIVKYLSGECETFEGEVGPWYVEVKQGMLQICSNSQWNFRNTKRYFIPLTNVKKIVLTEYDPDEDEEVAN